jgi:hypothetical protein
MALQDLTKRELAGLIAGATAANAIIGRIKEEEPEEIPGDVLRQWEIAALYHLEAAKDAIALGFKRRLEAGATIQEGPYRLEPDADTMEDLEETALEGGGGGGNCTGFAGVSYHEPKSLPLDNSGRVGRVTTRRRK